MNAFGWTRECWQCGTVKPMDDFSLQAVWVRGKKCQGRRYTCKVCVLRKQRWTRVMNLLMEGYDRAE